MAKDISSLNVSFEQLRSQLDRMSHRGMQISYGGKGFVSDIERLLDLLIHDIGVATSNKDKSELLEQLVDSIQHILLKARNTHDTS